MNITQAKALKLQIGLSLHLLKDMSRVIIKRGAKAISFYKFNSERVETGIFNATRKICYRKERWSYKARLNSFSWKLTRLFQKGRINSGGNYDRELLIVGSISLMGLKHTSSLRMMRYLTALKTAVESEGGEINCLLLFQSCPVCIKLCLNYWSNYK